MMRSREFLIERVLNLWTPEEKQPYADQVWDMLQRSYSNVEGGFRSATSPEDLIMQPGYWKLIKRGDKITAVNIYKKSPNTDNYKINASASETEQKPATGKYGSTEQGKKDYTHMRDADVKTGRAWAEVSGGPEKLMARAGARPIPSKFAAALTGKEILEYNPDGFHYTRLIQGDPHEKVMYGVAKLSPEGRMELEKHGIDLKELPLNVQA